MLVKLHISPATLRNVPKRHLYARVAMLFAAYEPAISLVEIRLDQRTDQCFAGIFEIRFEPSSSNFDKVFEVTVLDLTLDEVIVSGLARCQKELLRRYRGVI